ncbi:hypothetical protein ACFQPA_18740 [Halomarina halobia]|uniref:Cupin domain-containing protein n=1 Tax=Halomarina halobia TaxID=3033386 RepID=A0ABD6ACL2_9EURY|nr:hypothetical protein [Halomarina sp. PSR21]
MDEEARSGGFVARNLADGERTTFPNGAVDAVAIAGVTVKRATMRPGWEWERDESPLVGTDSCPNAHLLSVVAGRLGCRLDDGTEHELGPGDVAAVPPGHVGRTIGDEDLVYLDFDAGVDPSV